MSLLYNNYKGRPVTGHSYSGGTIFRFCKFRYKLERLVGWREKENRASTHFGKCVESAIQFHVDNKLTGGTESFTTSWNKFKDIKDLKYSEKEGDWETMNLMGRSMLQLFQVWWPQSGLTDPKWQLEYKKEVFPGSSKYAGLEFTSYTDLRATFNGKPLIVDIKTASLPLPENQAMLRLDPQLADYAWVTGIPSVAFLNLVKGGSSYSKGDTATIIATGEQRKVAFADSELNVVTLLEDKVYAEYDKKVKGVKGKALDEMKLELRRSPGVITLAADKLTKCRLQFLTTEIPSDIIAEAGEIEGRNIVDIVDANERNCWPKDGKGIRFPNNRCTMCPMRGICTGDNKLRDEILVKLNPDGAPVVATTKEAKPEEENWLDSLGE